MGEQRAQVQALEAACNCCNGRVGRQLLEMAENNATIRQMVQPTGVELLAQAARAGLAAAEAVNCCNGRVGRAMSVRELVAEMGGAVD